jgi:protein O-GlcNAc transferase
VADRISFVAFQPRPDYLATYHQIDIGLETLPYNGHTTSLDSFWMGVPVPTIAGQTVVGRAGVCLLENLGLGELIAQTLDEYVYIVSRLAANLPRLAELRANLRSRMETSPLMDGRQFAKDMEAAYRDIWRRWCEKSRRP